MRRPAEVLHVKDGDTFVARVQLGLGASVEEVVRVIGLDTCETRRILRRGVRVTDREVALGKEATHVARETLWGVVVELVIGEHGAPQRDNHGRVLARVLVGDRDYADLMADYDRDKLGFGRED